MGGPWSAGVSDFCDNRDFLFFGLFRYLVSFSCFSLRFLVITKVFFSVLVNRLRGFKAFSPRLRQFV